MVAPVPQHRRYGRPPTNVRKNGGMVPFSAFLGRQGRHADIWPPCGAAHWYVLRGVDWFVNVYLRTLGTTDAPGCWLQVDVISQVG